MKERWYDRSVGELEKLLETDRLKGLDRKEAARRLKTDGRNVIYPRRHPSLRRYLGAILSDLSALMLLFAALLKLIYSGDPGTVVILVILFVNYGIAVAYYIRSLRIMEDLGVRALPSAKVLRQGKLTVIPSEEIVMGDLILLSHGDIVPCDARLIDSAGLRVFEGGLFDVEGVSKKNAAYLSAGKSKPWETPNMVYASTVVTAGTGTAFAVQTGEDAVVCRLHRNKPIAACHKLGVIRTIRRVSTGVGVVFLIPALVMTLIALSRGGAVMDALLVSLSFAVAAMPELYAAFSYLAVSFGMRAVIADGRKRGESAFIKNPLSLPELNETDLLFVPLEKFRPEHMTRLEQLDDGIRAAGLDEAAGKEKYLRILRYALVSTGIYGAARLIEQNERRENFRTPEEDALILAGERLKIYDRTLEDRFPIFDHRARGEDGSLFDTTLVRSMSEYLVVLRGEVRQVLRRCTHYTLDDRLLPLDERHENELLLRADAMVHAGYMPVAVATRHSDHSSLLRITDSQTALTFEGFAVMKKPLIDNAAFCIAKLRSAGVDVIAYTSTESEEYEYLARALGIVRNREEHMRASEVLRESEDVFRLIARGKTFFEGFDETQMRYVVDLFKTEYKRKPGYCAERLEGVYPMCTATVGFAEEEGTTLGANGKRRDGSRSPLWMAKSAQHARYSCQALNHVADVILPPPGSDGAGVRSPDGHNGGIRSIAAAIRGARMIYRNIRLILLCIAVSCGMRFAALIASNFTQLFTAPQMLLSGSIFDLLSVFVIASERPEGRFVRRVPPAKMKTVVWELISSFLCGSLLFMPVYGAAELFASAGAIASSLVPAVAFTSLLITQAAILTAFLRSDRAPLRELTMTVSYAVYVLFLAAFLAVCFLVPEFGALFALSFPGIKGLLCALIPGACVLFASVVVRLVRMKRNKKAGSPDTAAFPDLTDKGSSKTENKGREGKKQG